MDAAPTPLPPNLWDPLPAEAQALILGLQAEIGASQERIRALEARAGQGSSNSSRPPSDPPHAGRKRPAPLTGRKRGGQPGHPAHFRPLLPTEQVDEVVVVAPEHCRQCHEAFPSTKARRPSRPWRHQVVELLPLAVRVIEYQMEVRRRPACGRRTRASLPAGVPQRPFGPRLTAVVALLADRYRLSRREVQQRAWLWTAVTPSLTTFLIDRSRGGAALAALLGEKYAGIVGSDRWSVYSRFPAERRALCYAHLKRDFQALVDRGAEAESIGRWGLAELERLFALWHRFRAGEFDRKALQRRLVPLQARLGRLVWRGEVSPDRKVAALCCSLDRWWAALWTFARVEGVEPTNNGAERALRPAVLWRKGSFGSDSEAGSRFAERVLTVVATCRQQGRRLLNVLVAAGEAALQRAAAPSLLPAR